MKGFKNSTRTQYTMTPAERDMSLETSQLVPQRAQENKMQGAKRGVVVNTKPATMPATRDGARRMSDLDRRTMEEPSAPYKRGSDTDFAEGFKSGKSFYDNYYARSLTPSDKGGIVGKISRGLVRSMAVAPMDALSKVATRIGAATNEDGSRISPEELRGQLAARKDTVGYKKGGKVKPTTRTADALRAQKYKAAMASRPNRNPRVIPAKNAAQVQAAAAGMRNALEKAISTRAAQQNAAQATPPMEAAAAPMEAAAPPMMGAPAMKKGGKVMKKANGGMASSIRSSADYNASDKDFISARADQIKALVGPKMKEGGKVDLKQDKALVKKAVHKHEASMHPGKPLTKLRKGGMAC